ncbi:hypothetical protein DASB73_037900 [Starmerella bacillaris]|uniref:Uncharacterized protein n=1 Tax=Starmerella bacillaris TaxID=1247836 RepID=A0AAV5RNY2_STABA|nr:hypothetical protein DASB73_037900 [Starmerella bacillaris]
MEGTETAATDASVHASNNSSTSLDESHVNHDSSFSDDEFGDFEEPEIQPQTHVEEVNDQRNSLKVYKSSEISQLSDSQLIDLLPPVMIPNAPFSEHNSPLENSFSEVSNIHASNTVTESVSIKSSHTENLNGSSEVPNTEEPFPATISTSDQLWHKLTEIHTQPLRNWNGTRVHKKLAAILGLPINLDAALPKVVPQSLDLPVMNAEQEVEGLQKVPEWALLSCVSSETVVRMSINDLKKHIEELHNALLEVSQLQDNLENREMDLKGEKNILEGMVESLLVFSQRNQRERIKVKLAKNLRR